ncbi:conserved exported hypothetical protein [uncultured Paludibacter sp.]|nr:conserved exported hypothetical protein [uncultured Paludibacter sp.]
MSLKNRIIPVLAALSVAASTAYGFVRSGQHMETTEIHEMPAPQDKTVAAEKDSTTRFPVDNKTTTTYEDLDKQYPMDLKDPENVKTVIEYDVKTGNYILRTKVGDTEVSTPYTMTPEEYRKYSEQEEINRYWRELNSNDKKNNEDKFSLTDMKFSLGPADKIFGPGGVQLKTSGQAELLFGFKSNFINNPALTERARRSNIPNFDQKIQLNVTGKVGDKVNFGMNYNTEASFDFDQKMIKLNYKGKEDDIIQNIEAGNVSMQLNSALITGSTALFGIKTDLQFGKLKISALASQQESQTQTVSSRGGVQTTSFEVNCDQYDANRHFFLSHYFRDHYEAAMSKLPLISSGITINRVEVWVTNKRGNFDEARNVVAFMDLAETDSIDKPDVWQKTAGASLPQNDANNLYGKVKSEDGIRNIQQTNDYLSTNYPTLSGGEDYEKIESARRLDPSEYTVNNTLGYISLRSMLNPDEVLAVAYEYTYGGKTYQVGEFSTDKGIEAPNALILKLLKSTTQSPKLKSWDLMMKNVYSIGAMQMQEEAFEMNVMYQNDSVGTELQYLQAGEISNQLLLRVMNLDNLDVKKTAHPDGKFDYIEGYTAQSSTGRVIFPVLEPFGSHLRKKIGNDVVASKYVYQELYDSTLVVAQEYSEKNKFRLVGKYKGSSNGSEIYLNAMNVPRGSVTVTAGGAVLKEGVDYTVDYTMGTVNIINQSILSSNTNIDVKLENQSMFSMQRKSLVGTHLEYEFSKNFTLGGTIMHLSEMPLTKKVNTGSEPLKNTIWGLNTAWRKESQWLTNALDKIPFVDVTQPSSIALNAEFAQLIPGHSNVISNQGLAYLDDFESTKTNIDIHYPYGWYLASTPALFDESKLSNNVDYGKNRALLAWYSVDPILNGDRRETPSNLRGNVESQSNLLTRAVRETELFPYKDLDPTRSSLLSILNLSYYPSERGPYNLDATGMNADGTLQNPDKRWGGIMRKLETTDFENANIEYIEFWMMEPFNKDNPDDVGGDLYFNLGDISEDILKDGKKFFENGMPVGTDKTQVEETVWGKVPATQSTVKAFDNTPENRKLQDVGLDGLTNEEEFLYPTYKDYVDEVRGKISPATLTAMQNNQFSPINDPSGDKYHFYRGSDYDEQQASILQRYKHYNGTEGNSPATEDTKESYSTTATLTPDVEDINGDNTLNEYEKYYQYKVSIHPNDMVVGKNHITDKLVSTVTLKNGQKVDIAWYQFKIPVREYDDPVGGIRNFKSIRFIRMFLTGFQKETHLRLGTLDLVRGEWKTYTKELYTVGNNPSTNGKLDVLAVNIEENGRKTPVNYVLPPGITRETDPSQPQLLQQNEQSMVLKVTDLAPKDARAVYKNTMFDMRKYKRLQMFVHAEAMLDAAAQAQNLKDGELTCFIRLGSDMKNNYYEYEIPLKLTPEGQYSGSNLADREKVWIPENMFDFPFTVLTDAKLKRNKERKGGTTGVGYAIPFEVYDNDKPTNKVTVVGNPSISEVENVMIGVRNVSSNTKSGEIWVNELRMSEFDEDGGWAALANLNVGLSDLGSVNVSGRMETSGFGNIESNIMDRRLDDFYQANLAAALDLGRFLPEKAKLQIPAYYAYTTETNSPKYNPLDEDIILKDALDNLDTESEKDSLRNLTQIVRTVESFNVANAKINIKSKKPQFYDPANITLSYSSNVTKEHTPEIEQNLTKVQRLGLNYAYSFNSQPWEPFKNVKAIGKSLKIIKDFNVYFLPTSLSYSTNLNRAFTKTKLRNFTLDGVASSPSEGLDTIGLSFSKDFTWNRQFDIQWNLTRGLRFGLTTVMNANIEESYYTPEIGEEYYTTWKNKVWESIKKMGTPYTYQQVFNASYEVPINKLPLLDWITANATYNSTYSWNRSAVLDNMPDVGNIASSMGNWSFDGNLNFETFYNKVKYLKDVNSRAQSASQPKRNFTPKKYSQTVNFEQNKTITINHQLGSRKFSITAKDKNGNTVAVPYKVKDDRSIEITPTANIEGVSINMTSRDPNERNAGQSITDFTTRFLMGLRRVSVTYRGTSSLVVPGFLNQPGLLGQQKVNGLFSPGLLFAFGWHDDNTLQQFIDKDWVYMGTDVVNPANEAKTSDLNIRVSIEPVPGLKIDLTAQRQTADNKVIQYMYEGMPTTFNGNFNITQIAIATAFDKIGTADENYYSRTFNKFLENRKIILSRLQNQMKDRHYPTTGFFAQGESGHSYAGTTYDETNGAFNENSPEVLIPAFLSAYTGRDPLTVTTNPFLSLLQMLPNWNINYNGLSNLEFFRDKFRSVSLTHAYTNRYTIGNYTSFSTWVPLNDDSNSQFGFIRDVQSDMPIPAMAYDISSVSMSESFSPLLGVNIAMKNNITTKVEYRKQRNLSLNLTSTQLIEADADEFVVGVGYIVNDFKLFLRSGSRKSSVKNDLKLNADVSYKDVKTLLRKVSENITQASSGNKLISIKCMADYVFSSKVNLQLYFDRQSTVPLISSTFPVSSTNFGISFKFMLTR